jgi:hypothetical protein
MLTRSGFDLPAVTRWISRRVIVWKRKPLPASLVKNRGGVICAVEDMWATTSRTLQPAHSDGLSQSASGSSARASTSEDRSTAIICQVSMDPPLSARPTR